MKLPMPKKSSKIPVIKEEEPTLARALTEAELKEFEADVARMNKAWNANYEIVYRTYYRASSLFYEGDGYVCFSAKWIFEENGVEKISNWIRMLEGSKLTDTFSGDWVPN